MALRYWVGTGDGNWGSTGNWSATSGGATGVSVPSVSDDVIFDSAGNNPCTVNATNRSCLSLTVTSGYTSTITHTFAISVAQNVVFNNTHTIAGTGGLNIGGVGFASSSITMNGQTWPNNLGIIAANWTLTIVGNLVVGGTFTPGSNTTLTPTTSETLSCNGFAGTGSSSGTVKLILTGGNWNTAVVIFNNLDLAGNITISGTVQYRSGTLTYVSGTITTTGSTLSLTGSQTLNTNGVTWNNVVLSNGSGLTYTLSSLLSISGTLTIGTGAVTIFAGTAGFTCGTILNQSTGVSTVTLKDGVTYTVTGTLDCKTSRIGAILTFTSSHASNRANLVLRNGADCQCLASFIRIDASGGRPIRSFNGTITDCVNIVTFFDLLSAGTFFADL